MLIDWIQDHPGSPPFKTRFRDPALLRSYGYDAIALNDLWPALPSIYQGHATALPGQSTQNAELPALLESRIAQAQAAGLQAFLQGDALVLPAHLVEEAPQKYLCDDHSHRLCPAKPHVLSAMARLVDEALVRFPNATGLILSTGEVHPESTPGLLGTPLHEPSCPNCRNLPLVQRLQAFLQTMFHTVVTQHHRILVHRPFQRSASASRTMHDDPQIFHDVTADLPQSSNLIFSFHSARGDYRQGNPVNPNLLSSDPRPKWIEFQCERELEGKGAFPNFRPPQWSRRLHQILSPSHLPDSPIPPFSDSPPSSALSFLTTSRGGGWGGPYLQREEWVDANLWSLAQLYRNPNAHPAQLAQQWTAKTFSISPDSPAALAMAQLLELSAPTLHDLVYAPAPPSTNQPAETEVSFISNDQIDVEALWNSTARLLDPALADAACRQKLTALGHVETMRQTLGRLLPDLPPNAPTRELANTLTFYNSFAGTLAHLFCGFVRYFQWQRTNKTDPALATQATDHLEHAQAHWQHHTQRHAMLPGAPSVFQETTLWERTNNCLEELSAHPNP